ncbi:MAG: DUF2232 domain-containing protein [Gammaproteobacteria bacterium]|nr:DUF2232 domain-containing protein [Gammaproteobacteria bacterium]
MKALGNYILRTRIHAILAISVLTVFSIFISPFSYFISGAPMGLAALRKGAVTGLQVAAGCLLLTALPVMALNQQPGVPIAFMATVWLPVILCAGLLRNTQSQGLMVLCAGTIGVFFTALIYVMLEDIQKWWHEWFELWKEYAASEPARQQLEQAYQLISPLLSAIFASGFVISLIITMLLARWWQSALFNPGGFRKEFYALRLPRILVFPTLAGLLTLLLIPDGASMALRDTVILMLVLYLFQGISVIHGFLYTRARSRVWLIVIYGMFFIMPRFILLFVSCVGIVNACLGGKPVRIGDNNA